MLTRRPLRLTWIAPRDPFSEAESFLSKRIPSSVYGLVAWEVDYIKELLSHLDVRYSHAENPYGIHADIVVYSRNQFHITDIRRGLKAAKPRLVFHLSDEFGQDASWCEFLKKYPLVLKQYHFNSYPKHDNIKTMPLGYMEGMFGGPTTGRELIESLEARDRPFAWSFIGGLKGDRAAALEKFAPIGPNHVGSAHPLDMAEIYRNSKFVVCPAGNANILCFRAFEASICGAIPVVAGCSTERYREATAPLGNPPWVFHETWDAATEETKLLLANETALAARRQSVLAWWGSELRKVRGHIDSVLAG